MKLLRILVMGAAVGCFTGSAIAADDLKVGTGGAPVLRIPVGSRGTALGGSVVALSGGVDAFFWNPAGAANIEGTDVMLSRRHFIADINVDYFVAARQIGDAGVLAVTAKILSTGDELITTEDLPDGNGTTFGSSFSVVGASYARTLTDRVSLGINANMIFENIADQTATGFAVDVGFRYDPGWNGMSFGAVIKNLGPKMRYDGPGFEVDDSDDGSGTYSRTRSAAFELPSYFQLGVAYKMYDQNNSVVNMTGTFQSNNFAGDEYRFGSEYAFDETFFLRGGYTASDQTGYLYGFSAGAGLAFTVGESVMHFDYAWSESGEFFDNSQYLTFQIDF